ncbi:hypothetical protein YC2023_066512 [Brassica napus]
MHVRPEVILPIDPFVTPEFPLFSRKLVSVVIEHDVILHVDAAFAMLNQKRIEQSSWFSEQSIPKA